MPRRTPNDQKYIEQLLLVLSKNNIKHGISDPDRNDPQPESESERLDEVSLRIGELSLTVSAIERRLELRRLGDLIGSLADEVRRQDPHCTVTLNRRVM
jgi:hypothetical protein